MNTVLLIGRLTKDPVVNTSTDVAVGRFSIAIDRGKDKSGNSRGADYPNIVCFGKTAELVEKYLGKGRLVAIIGKIQTGKYEKDGKTIYTTEVLADRVEFLDHAEKAEDKGEEKQFGTFAGFTAMDEACPF